MRQDQRRSRRCCTRRLEGAYGRNDLLAGNMIEMALQRGVWFFHREVVCIDNAFRIPILFSCFSSMFGSSYWPMFLHEP